MSGVCCSCQSILRFRLRTKLQALESLRRGYHHTPAVKQDAQPHEQTKRNTRSLYSDTIPPTLKQASAASLFFKQNQPRIAWVANEWRKQSHSPPNSHDHPSESTFHLLTPEIAFLGRSNTGKSSLLNALLESPGLCRVGSKPGKTTTMHAWTLSTSTGTPTTNPSTKSSSSSGPSPHDRVTVLDMPGYGHGSHDEWGADIVKYLKRRRQLRRAMVLLNPKHGVKDVDRQILELLRTNNVPYQVVACKCDTLPTSELPLRLTQLQADVNQIERVRIPGQGATLCISDLLAVGKLGDGKMNKTFNPKAAFGLDEVRWAILQATGLDEVALQQWMKAQEKYQRQVPLYRRGQKSLEQIDARPQPKVMDTTLAG